MSDLCISRLISFSTNHIGIIWNVVETNLTNGLRDMQDNPNRMKLMNPAEVGVRLGVSTSSLAKWRLSGDGPPYVKVGTRIAYDEDMVEAWLRSRVRKSTSDGRAA